MMIILAKILILIFVFVVTYWIATRIYISLLTGKKTKKETKEKRPDEQMSSKEKLIKLITITKNVPKLRKQIKFVSTLIMVFLVYIVTNNYAFAVVGGIIGFFLPGYIINKREKHFIEKFNNQLIDGLGLVANSLRAGSNFFQALELLVKESPSPLSDQFGYVVRELRLGTPTQEALKHLSERIPSQELKITITAINISLQLGGNLAEILDRITTTMKQRNTTQGQIKSLTAQGRLSGIVVGLMPFLLMIILQLMDPGMMKPIFTTFIGNMILFTVCILVFTGWIIIQKIVAIDI